MLLTEGAVRGADDDESAVVITANIRNFPYEPDSR